MSEPKDSKKYACPNCGGVEYITNLNVYDIYMASDGKLRWQKSEPACGELTLFCRDCSERAPAEYAMGCDRV